jgi:hypothetical protein
MMDMCRKILHNDYNKIQDHVTYMGEFELKMFVRLNGNSKKYGRSNWYSEAIYSDSNNESGVGVTITRRYMPYISLEAKPGTNNIRKGVAIIFDDMYFLKREFIPTEEWFNLDNGVFAKNNDDRVFIPRKNKVVKLHLKYGGYLEVQPAIQDNTLGTDQFIGVILFMGDSNTYTFVPVDQYLTFIEFIKTCNMLQMAQSMVLMLNSIGNNRIDLTKDKYTNKGPVFLV